MNRILAIALALIIGSPNCWCCMGARTVADAVPAASCCAPAGSVPNTCPMKQGGDRRPGSDKSCACDSAKAAREASGGAVMVPAASAFFTVVLPLASVLVISTPSYSAWDSVMSHGPLWHPRPIFARDCALRL